MHKRSTWTGAAGRLMSGVSVLAGVATLAMPEAALAQAKAAQGVATSSRNDAPGGEVPDIVVTAQKRAENLQNVPIAVTALSPALIEKAQVRSFADLNGLAPNLTVTQGPSTTTPIVVMRGIFAYSLANGVDTPVATYVDGVYYSRMIGAAFDTADLERVEVLRGPQGTLYGRNSTGGAINFITAGPKGEFHARQELTVGNDGRLRVKTRVDLPSFGAFSISGTFVHDEIDGYIHNTTPGVSRDYTTVTRGYVGTVTSPKSFGGDNTEAALVAARYAPDSIPLKVDYRFSWSHADKTPVISQVLGFPNTPAGQFGQLIFFGAPPFIPGQTGYGGTPVVSLKRLSSLPDSIGSPEHLSTWSHSLTAALDLPGDFQFKSITGYHGSTDSVVSDLTSNGLLIDPPAIPLGPTTTLGTGTGQPYSLLSAVIYEKTKQFSEELQLSRQSRLFDFIGGFYYAAESTLSVGPDFPTMALPTGLLPGPNDQYNPFFNPTGQVGSTESYNDSTSHNRSIAGFFQSTLHVTDKVDLTGGVRYTHDTRKTTSRSVLSGIVIPNFSKGFNNTSWMTNVSYRPTNNYTFYAKASTGYLSGGVFNGFVFEPEKLTQYEIGAKTQFFDRHLRVNVAGFYSDYKNQQIGQINAENIFVLQNAGKARIYGAEVEMTAVPVDGLSLNVNYGYTNFKYQKYIIGGVNVASTIGQAALPDHTLMLGAQYDLPEWSNGIKPSFSLDGNWHSKFDGAPFITTYSPAVRSALRDNSFWNIDGRATLAAIPVAGNLKGKVSVWVKNLLDKQKVLSGADLNLVVVANYNRGRTFGADFALEF